MISVDMRVRKGWIWREFDVGKIELLFPRNVGVYILLMIAGSDSKTIYADFDF